ncbi:hypothetical protein DSO57_1002011 [Entomophthora muscae]|uniref:Uncharacterized protein n=1 Tax=Entomophthora muscae TaxID=34485 RepID=A0ACC2RNX3_9FUNG|nr:hypothetical protein DSO57_1002011 [Entomophthora muscae]
MTRDTLAGLTHAKGASEWAFTAYKDAQLVRLDPVSLSGVVVNSGIHHVLILPLLGHFKDKYLAFAFDSQNELASASGNMIVWFPDSAQLTCPTHACG